VIEAQDIALSDIDFDEVKIREAQVGTQEYDRLKYSIELEGVQLPILVRPKRDATGQPVPGKFIGIDGCQRWSISKELRKDTIPCRIMDHSEDDCRRLQMILNRNRVKQTKIQELDHVKTYMMHNPNMTQADVAIAFNMTQAELSNLLGLERLTKEATELLSKGKITPTSAIALSRIPQEHQNNHLKEAQEKSTNEFINYAKTEIKKIRAAARGENPDKVLNLVLRKKAWFEDQLAHLTNQMESMDTDNEDYLFVAGQMEFCKLALQIDEESLRIKEEEKKKEKEKKEKEKIPAEVQDHIKMLERRLQEAGISLN